MTTEEKKNRMAAISNALDVLDMLLDELDKEFDQLLAVMPEDKEEK